MKKSLKEYLLLMVAFTIAIFLGQYFSEKFNPDLKEVCIEEEEVCEWVTLVNECRDLNGATTCSNLVDTESKIRTVTQIKSCKKVCTKKIMARVVEVKNA